LEKVIATSLVKKRLEGKKKAENLLSSSDAYKSTYLGE
jgi:hypothetical protein